MKLLAKQFTKEGPGWAKMVPEEGERMRAGARAQCTRQGSPPPPPRPAALDAPSSPSGPPPGEDLWHAYNLVREGDRVEATTFRKVQRDTGTGGESEKVKLRLMVAVEAVEYDAEGGRQLGWSPTPASLLDTLRRECAARHTALPPATPRCLPARRRAPNPCLAVPARGIVQACRFGSRGAT